MSKKLRYKAMDLLARREHSRSELATKLSQRFPDSTGLEAVLDGLEADGLQSDSRFAGSFFRLRVQGGFGPQRIRAELRQRGIKDDLITQQFTEHEVDWFLAAQVLFAKKYANVDMSEPRLRAKCIRYMQYKGYQAEHISALF